MCKTKTIIIPALYGYVISVIENARRAKYAYMYDPP